MFKKKLETIFLTVILISISILSYNYYKSYSFKNNDIPDSYKQRIINKEQEVLKNMEKNFGQVYKFPLIVTDRFQGNLYGLTSYKHGEITIFLNKKVMKKVSKRRIEANKKVDANQLTFINKNIE